MPWPLAQWLQSYSLQIPADSNAVNLILAPYLINIKKLSYDDALNIINSWLSKCGKLRQLDQNFDYMVGYALKNGYRSLKLETLKMKNRMLEHVHRHRQYVSLQRLEAGKSQTLYLAHIVEGR
jgi:hypothetical protein